jgi:hypothetical protein
VIIKGRLETTSTKQWECWRKVSKEMGLVLPTPKIWFKTPSVRNYSDFIFVSVVTEH